MNFVKYASIMTAAAMAGNGHENSDKFVDAVNYLTGTEFKYINS